MDMNKRLGAEDKSPGMAVVFHMGGGPKRDYDPSKRLGEKSSDDEAPAESGNPDELMDKAVEGLCRSFNVSPKAVPSVRQDLEAFVHAAVSKTTSDTGPMDNEED